MRPMFLLKCLLLILISGILLVHPQLIVNAQEPTPPAIESSFTDEEQLSGRGDAAGSDIGTPVDAGSLGEAHTYAALLAKAKEKGSVRVIVGLNVEWQPLGRVSPQRALHQQTGIAQTQDRLLNRLAAYNATPIRQYQYIPAIALKVDATALEQLVAAPEVRYIEEDVLNKPALPQSTRVIGADLAWDAGFSGEGQTIAILDTGVDSDHPFLQGKVVSEACYSTTDPDENATSVCPDGSTAQIGAGSGVPCDAAINGCNHGTHVAGIAAGRLDFSNIFGVARDADIMSIQVFSRIDNTPGCVSTGDSPTCECKQRPSPCTQTFASDQVAALDRVLALRGDFTIAAVNMSLGGGEYTSVCDDVNQTRKQAIDSLRSVGIAVAAASGNDRFTDAIIAPACISSAISVGSTDDGSFDTTRDEVSDFSNSASFLDLLAPGRWIFSSVPGGEPPFENKVGTSMAAPHVAGAFAILKERAPVASAEDFLSVLKHTGVAITDARNDITKPRIQIDAALNAFVDVDASATGFENGSPDHPYDTVTEGVNNVPTHGIVLIRPGTYRELLTIDRAMTLRSTGGIVTIIGQ